jgi:hypothetical protein
MDAYTSSAYYPYSRHYATTGRWTNYIRNSVKVVVDAYNGTVQFYVAEPQDPLINAYRRAFPALFRDLAQMPAELRAHLRYPEYLFRTQADVYGLYHIRDVKIFFGREDVWSVAQQTLPDADDSEARRNGGPINPALVPRMRPQPAQPIDPYFVLMRLPGEREEDEFVQILPFTPSGRTNMNSWMAGRSDGENYGRLLAYDFPKSPTVDGPAQIKARINQNSFLSERFTLWNQQGSRVLRGNMLVIPLADSLLYIEPIFLQANQSATPELRLVVLATQDRVVYGTTFQEALSKLVGAGAASAITGTDAPASPDGQAAGDAGGAARAPATSAGAVPAPPSTGRQQLIERAARDLEEYQRFTAQGRYSEAGQRLESLRNALNRLRTGAPGAGTAGAGAPAVSAPGAGAPNGKSPVAQNTPVAPRGAAR